MNRLIDIVICLCERGRSFNSYDKCLIINNQGLIKEILNLLSKYNDLLKFHLKRVPRNKLRSNRIQNNII